MSLAGRPSRAPFVLAGLLHACSGTGGSTAADHDPRADSVAPPGSASVAETAAPLPDKVEALAEAVPEHATIFVSLPSLSAIGLPKETLDEIVLSGLQEAAASSGMAIATLKAVVDGFEGAVGFSLGASTEHFSSKGPPPIGAVLRFRDPSVVERLIRDLKLKQLDEQRWILEKGKDSLHVAWLAKPSVLIVSPSEAVINDSLDTLSGKRRSFASSPHHGGASRKGRGNVSLFVDLHRLLPHLPEAAAAGSHVLGWLSLDDSQLQLFEYGEKVPRFGAVVAPSSHPALGALPSGAVIGLDLSLKRRPGKSLRDVLIELARPSSVRTSSVPDEADEELKNIGLTLNDLEAALGESIAAGIYLPSGAGMGAEITEKGALLIALRTNDSKAATKIFDAVGSLAKRDKSVKVSPGKLTGTLGGRGAWLARAHKGSVTIALGEARLVQSLDASHMGGKDLLGATPAFASFKKSALPESHLAIYVDADALAKVTGKPMGFATGILAGDLLLAESARGLELTLRGGAAVAVIGTASAVAIYGVRRYLASAKSAEAKNSIGAIARGAIAAYERESVLGASGGALTHALCKSAPPVPSKVPSGVRYQPDSSAGKDYETGDATTGWKCLKFSFSSPQYFQYEYRRNADGKGFEIIARGDLDGDGKTSLFVQRGVLNPRTQSVRLATELEITDELE